MKSERGILLLIGGDGKEITRYLVKDFCVEVITPDTQAVVVHPEDEEEAMLFTLPSAPIGLKKTLSEGFNIKVALPERYLTPERDMPIWSGGYKNTRSKRRQR